MPVTLADLKPGMRIIRRDTPTGRPITAEVLAVSNFTVTARIERGEYDDRPAWTGPISAAKLEEHYEMAPGQIREEKETQTMDKLPKPKPVNYRVIEKDAEPEMFDLLKLARYDHAETAEARIGLAWRHNQNPNADGKIALGKCVKVSDLQREFARYDFIIVLDCSAWQEFSREQRLALLDHELCHAAPSLDEDANPRYDVRGRPVFRLRKHDLEEFREVVERHGCYMSDLEEFARALGQEPSLFSEGERKEAAV